MSNQQRDVRVGRDSRHVTRDAIRATFSRVSLAALLLVSASHAESLSDPTRPYAAVAKSTSTSLPVIAGLRVTAIMQTGGNKVAVVDGKVVKSGDRVGDVVIEEVLSDGVRFKRAGLIEYARLPKQAVPVRHVTAREE